MFVPLTLLLASYVSFGGVSVSSTPNSYNYVADSSIDLNEYVDINSDFSYGLYEYEGILDVDDTIDTSIYNCLNFGFTINPTNSIGNFYVLTYHIEFIYDDDINGYYDFYSIYYELNHVIVENNPPSITTELVSSNLVLNSFHYLEYEQNISRVETIGDDFYNSSTLYYNNEYHFYLEKNEPLAFTGYPLLQYCEFKFSLLSLTEGSYISPTELDTVIADSYQQGYDDGYLDGNVAGTETGYDNGYNAGYNDGFNAGYTSGYNQGYNEGYSIGSGTAYSEGSSSGYSTGYEIGYDSGYTAGKTAGFEEGRSVGYDSGYRHGLNDGYQNAVNASQDASVNSYREGYDLGYEAGVSAGYNQGVSTQTYSFRQFFGAIADTPILFVRQLLGFDVFGVSAITILMTMITGCLVLFVFRKIVL